MEIKRLVYILIADLLLLVAGCQPGSFVKSGVKNSLKKTLILATTTSVYDSGLLEKLVADFEKKFGCGVKVVAVGSGEALKMGEMGDVDVLLVHSPEAERKFMKKGFGKERALVMRNYFVFLGPYSDPARVRGLPVTDCFRLIAKRKKTFVSRADGSGTHQRELRIWKEVGVTPCGSWYLKTGQGMGESLKVASEKQAYILSDRATYLTLKANLELQEISTEGSDLLNEYTVITVNPRRFPKVNYALAKKFYSFLLSQDVQSYIADFGKEEFGEALFLPPKGEEYK